MRISALQRSVWFVLAVSFLCLGTGCAIKVAPSTQQKMAELETSRSFALAYARAAKTAGVVDDDSRQSLSDLYMKGATKTTTFVNLFVGAVDNTSLNSTIDPSLVDPQADIARMALNDFLTKAREEIDNKVWPADFGATALAVASALKAAKEIADFAVTWWNEATERERTRFKKRIQPLAMPAWVEVEPLKVESR